MRMSYRSIGIALVLLMLSGLLLPVHAQDKITTQHGMLTAVDDQNQTIAVQVLKDDGQPMTVAGPLVEGAVVLIEGHTGGLPDLVVGENVTIQWKDTPEGVSILAIEQR